MNLTGKTHPHQDSQQHDEFCHFVPFSRRFKRACASSYFSRNVFETIPAKIPMPEKAICIDLRVSVNSLGNAYESYTTSFMV